MSTYPLRLADNVMEEAKQAAAEDNVSLNQLLSAFIADGVGHRRAILNLKRRAARGNAESAPAILDRAPDVAPDLGDELIDEGSSVARPPLSLVFHQRLVDRSDCVSFSFEKPYSEDYAYKIPPNS
jgi:hypothetical protein